jgi:hypothetical protein
MRVRHVRFTVRRMMAAVAVVGVGVAFAKLAGELRYWTSGNGWDTSVLPVGIKVSTCHDLKTGEATIPNGTGCVVLEDLTDDDSAYPDRKVVVRVSEGSHSGSPSRSAESTSGPA